MNKLIAFSLALFVAAPCFAFTETREINTSSFTATNETTTQIAGTSSNTDLRAIIVSSGASNGSLTVYDSQGSATNKVAVVDLGTIQEAHFNVRLSSGITYTTTGNSRGVTILYHVN